MILIFTGYSLSAQRLSREYNISLLINQAGYVPDAAKMCVAMVLTEANFQVIDVVTQEVEFTGKFEPVEGDFGRFAVGDFSWVNRPGRYYILSDALRSYPLTISEEVYSAPIQLIVQYFSKQRCGGSAMGYLSPCHLDDGVRMDNGKHQDVSGGWHDASDLRKWIGATIFGMIGIGKACELQSDTNQKMMEELRWGNRYFLNMQEPEGYVMSYVG